MDDIEKRIELKNLEIKKMRLEQELSNLSNDSYQEPQTTQNTQKATTSPNIPYNKPGNVNNDKRNGCLFFIAIFAVIFGYFYFTKVDFKDDKAVIKDMQGTWVAYEPYYIHYKIEISGNHWKGWMAPTNTDDEPSWSYTPAETGTFSLGAVGQIVTGKYRQINFTKDGGDESLIARAFEGNIIYHEGSGMYLIGAVSAMDKK